ncbi:MAG: hypothetical protein ACRD0K_05960 [Egibacteraceae bacterium]
MSGLPLITRDPAATARLWDPGRGLLGRLGPATLTLLALGLWLFALSGTQIDGVDDLGLISVLHPVSFAGLALLTAGMGWELARPRRRPAVMVFSLIAAVFMLHGVTALVEPLPRFATAWLHSGFVEHIARTGHTLPSFDARFSWPGFFAAAALLAQVSGVDSALAFLRWTPVVVNALALLPLSVLFRALADDDRPRWAALWLFVVANWIGQDYFAPQAFTYLLYLTVIALLCRYLLAEQRDAAALPTATSRWLGAVERCKTRLAQPLAPPTTAPQLGGLITAIVVIAAAIAISHQLTPFILVLVTGALVAARRIIPRGLPVLFGLLAAAWVSYGATAFWLGHLDSIIGNLGRVGSTVDANLSNRFAGSPGRLVVVAVRLGLSASVGLAAGFGILRRWRAGRLDLTTILLAGMPFAVLGLQSYGGEVLLRAYLFALPALALLAAFALWPAGGIERRHEPLLLTTASLALLAAFFVARYGNERFEYISYGELQVVEEVYAQAPIGATLVAVSPNLPWRYRDIERFHYQPSLDDFVLSDPLSIRQLMRQVPQQPAYLLITRGQVAYVEAVYGYPRGWADQLAEQLLASGEFQLVRQTEDSLALLFIGEVT